ncbi:MAG: hypothetical protein R2750_05505 [Bacteroidales bacterium]
MIWYHWLAIGSLGFCLANCFFHFLMLVKLGKPTDLSEKRGNTNAAIVYAFTGAMSPTKKESAFLHLPTYTAGLLYHVGTFLSIFVFIMLFLGIAIEGWFAYTIAAILLISGISGAAILIKRIIKKQLRDLSNPDDYISNLLVTFVQFLSIAAILNHIFLPVYFVLASILFLYLPLGKLKHTIYFFAARYHLGIFYGWRGVWPPQQK